MNIYDTFIGEGLILSGSPCQFPYAAQDKRRPVKSEETKLLTSQI